MTHCEKGERELVGQRPDGLAECGELGTHLLRLNSLLIACFSQDSFDFVRSDDGSIEERRTRASRPMRSAGRCPGDR
jgi:hypothetical protein